MKNQDAIIASEIVVLSDGETFTESKGCVYVLDGVGYDIETLFDIVKKNGGLEVAIIGNGKYFIDEATNEPYVEMDNVNEDDGILG